MAITFVGSDSKNQPSGTNDMTMVLPTHQADDFAVIYGKMDAGGGFGNLDIGTATGWTTTRIHDDVTGPRDSVRALSAGVLTGPSQMTLDAGAASSGRRHSSLPSATSNATAISCSPSRAWV